MTDIREIFSAMGLGVGDETPVYKPVYSLPIPDDRLLELFIEVDNSEIFNSSPMQKDAYRAAFLARAYWRVICDVHPAMRYRRLRLNITAAYGAEIEVLSHSDILAPARSKVLEPNSEYMSDISAIALNPDFGARVRKHHMAAITAKASGFELGKASSQMFNDLFIIHPDMQAVEEFNAAVEESCAPSGDLN